MKESKEYFEKLEFEHELINRRLTWLLTSQSILFAALAFVLGNEFVREGRVGAKTLANAFSRSDFFNILGCLGFTISLLIWIGVFMGIIAKCTTWYDERMKHWYADVKRPWILPLLLKDACSKRNRKNEILPLGVRTYITLIALVPDFFMPLAFAWAWWRIMKFGT